MNPIAVEIMVPAISVKKYTKLRFGFSVLQDLPSGLCDGKTALDWAITRMNPSRQNFSIRYRSSTRTERMHD